MNSIETAKILGTMTALFPNFKISEDEYTNTLKSWAIVFADYDYKTIEQALLMFVRTSGSAFAPSAPQLLAMTQKPAEMAQMNPIEAWGLVNKAVRRSIYYAEEEFEKLPAAIQKTVGSADQLRAWAMSEEDTLETVIASNFQKTYRATLDRQREINLMPGSVQAIVKNTVAEIEKRG